MSDSPSEAGRLRADLDRLETAIRQMQQVARLGVWERDLETGGADWSAGVRSLLGWDSEEQPTLDAFLMLVHPGDRPRIRRIIQEALAGAHGYEYDCRVHVAGEERRMRVNAEIQRGADGRPTKLFGIIQDVTDWQRSEAALARSEALQAAVVDAAFDCVVVIDADGRVVDWNPSAERTFGWSRREALGRELAQLIIPPDRREAHRRALAEHGRREPRLIGRRVELTALRRDGSEFPVELAIAEVAGEQPLFAGYLRDITERREGEQARRAAESRWRALVEQLPAVTYLARFDPEATLLYISPQVEGLTGLPPERWTEQTGLWLQLVHPADLERVRSESAARFAERRGFSCVYRMRDANGDWMWVEEQSTILPGEDGEPRYLQGLMVDVTERRRHEEELREAQRLESVGQLAGGIAHDFNNLLGIIQGYAELLEADVPESSRPDVLEIHKAAERAAELTTQLLLFGRRQPAEAQAIDVGEVVGDLRNMLQRTLGESVDFAVELDPEPCQVRLPAGQLEQILVNLTVNARDAMPVGGTLTIRSRRVGDRVALSVADDGVGMTDDVATRAFDPFFTTKEKGRGTGLGLATVYGIVQGAGGRVQLDTLPGRGTTVEIELPLDGGPSEERPRGAPAVLRGRGETVLVVEDEDAVRELTGRILAENGYRVIHARDGYRARSLCDEFDGEIDLLLSDVVMPDMSGCEVAAKLRELRPDLKVLYMSGHPGDVLDHHGLASEEMQLLAKPFDREKLLASVREALGSPS